MIILSLHPCHSPAFPNLIFCSLYQCSGFTLVFQALQPYPWQGRFPLRWKESTRCSFPPSSPRLYTFWFNIRGQCIQFSFYFWGNGCSKYNSTGNACRWCGHRIFRCSFTTTSKNAYLTPTTATNIAFVFLVVGHVLPPCPQLCESVNHDTADNVAEQQPEEDEVYEVSNEAG